MKLHEIQVGQLAYHPGTEISGRVISVDLHLGWVKIQGNGGVRLVNGVRRWWHTVGDFAGNFEPFRPF